MQNGEAAAAAGENRGGRGGPPSLEDAARALDVIDACLLGLLPASTGSAQGGGAAAVGAAAQWPTSEQATQRAEALVDASATISRALRAFGAAAAAPPPPPLSLAAANGSGDDGRRQQQRERLALLRRAVAGLEAEVRNADALLERSRASVSRWRAGAEAAKGAIDQSLALPEEA